MTKTRIRVLVVDDHFLVRQGVVALLATTDDIEVVGQAGTAEEALTLHRALVPDVTLVDVRLPDKEGPALIRELRAHTPQARFVALSNYEGDEDIHRALEAGASTYLFKRSVQHDLLDAIRAVVADAPGLPDEVQSRLAARARLPDLTGREMEVLALIARGRTNKEIAAILDVSVHTVNTHVAHIIDKLGAEDRTHAVATALRRGLVRVD